MARQTGTQMYRRRSSSRGFTLIEMLVVVALIGILSAIALRQFAIYRNQSYDARANSDLRNAATAEEAYFASNGEYIGGQDTGPTSSTFLPGLHLSPTVTLQMSVNGSDSFSGTAASNQGTRTFTYNSALGGIQ